MDPSKCPKIGQKLAFLGTSWGALLHLCEQLDELRAMSVRHFGSKADDEEVEAGTLQLGKPGQVKIRKSKVETSAPGSLEELRSKIILMANHFIFAKLRYSNN